MTARARGTMELGEVAVSAVTVWEIRRKVDLGKLGALHFPEEGNLTAFLERRGFELRGLSAQVAQAAALPPNLHRDPMDRFLIAQALAEGATILTNDRAFAACGAPTLW